MDKCPYCGAETRPGDNFCLNCGNRLLPSTPSPQQAQSVIGDATIPASEDWVPPGPEASPSAQESGWRDYDNLVPIASMSMEPTASPVDTSASSSSAAPIPHGILDKVEHPARLILRTDTGEILQEYTLEKSEISIGRAPTSDILLSKDKLTSRRHATIRYENGNYSIHDERSANGTFVNGQQLEEMMPRTLQDGDHIGIGEYELVFLASESASSGVDLESMPTITLSPSAIADITYRTREDALLTEAIQPGSRGTPAYSSAATPIEHDILDKVEHPARLILRTDTGEVLQEYLLEKVETSIGRAPTNDILLSKEKLTSRRHATVKYENGNYVILDERSANGTFVNGQQLEEMVPLMLHDGDHIGIGEHELLFQAYQSASSDMDIESLPEITVSPAAFADITYRTHEDELLSEPVRPDSRGTSALLKLAENFARYERHLAYYISAETPDPTIAIDDRDLDLPIPFRLQQIQTDRYALRTFVNKNQAEYHKYVSRLVAEPENGLHAFYTARHCFAVRDGQRALGFPAEQLLPWPELLQRLLEQVQHPDLQQVLST